MPGCSWSIPARLSLDQVAIAEIVADRLRTLFEHSMLTRRLSHTAAMEERVKIGRELHDGFLSRRLPERRLNWKVCAPCSQIARSDGIA